MTSLERQLNNLAQPQAEVLLGDHKQRASVLFDKSVASTLGEKELYGIGMNGLEELERIEPQFQIYENSLFSEATMSFERMRHEKAVNETLDETIAEFLIKVSPYFMRRASMKALEWLVYRYRIHLHNMDDILRALLPYYNTTSFVKVIQTFRLKEKTGRWIWLHPSKESGAPIARITLLNQCIKDPSFFHFLCTMVPKHLKVQGTEAPDSVRNVIQFVTSIIVGSLQLGKIKETTISTLLPYILDGFKTKSVDYRDSAYLILCQITSATQLKQNSLQKIVASLTKRPETQTTEMMRALLIIYQSQNIQIMEKRTFKRMCKIPGLVEHFQVLTGSYQTEKLLLPFFTRLVPYAVKDFCSSASSSEGEDSEAGGRGRPQYLSLLESILHGSRLQNKVALRVAESIAQQYAVMKERHMMEEVLDKIRELFTTVEKKYPTTVDVLAERSTEDECLQELLAYTKQNLVLSLNHVKAEIRCLAVEKLSTVTVDEVDALVQSVVSRVGDDSVKVVEAVLKLANLRELVPSNFLIPELLKLIDAKRGKEEWTSVTASAIRHLTVYWTECEGDLWWQVYIRFISYLLCGPSHRNGEIIVVILKSKEASREAVLKVLTKLAIADYNSDKSRVAIGSKFCELVAGQSSDYRDKLVTNLMVLVGNKETKYEYLPVALRLLTELVQRLKNDVSARLTLSRLLFDIAAERMATIDGKLDDCTSVFDTDSTGTLVQQALVSVVTNLEKPEMLNHAEWWNPGAGEEVRLFVVLALDILRLLNKYAGSKKLVGDICRSVAPAIGKSCLAERSTYCGLISAAFSGDESMTPLHQHQSLCCAKIALANADATVIGQILSGDNTTMPCLLMALGNGYQSIREAACSLMQDLCQVRSAKPYQVLCKRLVKVAEEMVSSGEYLIQAMSTIYEEPQTTKSRRKSGEIQSLNIALNDLLNVTFGECTFAVKEATLIAFSLIQTVDFFKRILPLMNGLLKKMSKENLSKAETRCLDLLVRRFSPEATQIFVECEVAAEIFFTCLRATTGHYDDYHLSVQRLTLKRVTPEFYESLPSDELRKSFLSNLFDMWVDNDDPEMNKHIGKRMRSLPLEADHISTELRKLLPDTAVTVKDTKRVRRGSGEICDNVFETRPWRRTILVMEIVHTKKKKKISNIHKLTQDLFPLLKYAVQQENQSSADYFKQLVMSCLLVIYQGLVDDKTSTGGQVLPEGVELNVELIIQCIRTSDSAQTYHHALILLSKAVLLEPGRVLHNVMTIFTFMGANIMRQDDGYSFRVLTDTIDSIIPALLVANQNEDVQTNEENVLMERLKIPQSLASSVRHIIQVFVDAYPHMPQHRRPSLFEKLMLNLNPRKFLWMLIALMVDAHLVRHRDKTGDESQQKVDEFCLKLCDAFRLHDKIGTAYKLLMYINTELKDLENKKEPSVKMSKSKAKAGASSVAIDFTTYKSKDVKVLKYALVNLVAQLLTGAKQHRQFEGEKTRKLVKLFELTMEECLLFITCIGRAMSQETNTYWPALLAGAYRILDELQTLLKDDVFVKVIGGLIENELPIIRRKTMELLAHKLSAPKFVCPSEQVESFLRLVPVLTKAARAEEREGGVSAVVANRHAALLALRAMCKMFGAQNQGKFQPLLLLISKLMNETSPTAVMSSAVALLAELVTCLRAHAISSLGDFMPGLIKIFRQNRDQVVPGAYILISNTVTAVQKIVEVLPHFISPYLYDLLSNIFRLSSRNSDQDASHKMHERLVTIRKQLSEHITTRVFLPNLTRCYKELNDENQWRTVAPIMAALTEHISIMSSDNVTSYNGAILNLFLLALDFRSEHDDLKLADIALVENSINVALTSLVMKLSETTFRPLFYRLHEWATSSGASKDRLLAFYRLCNCLALKMKNLFTKFAGHILPNVAVLLDANNIVKTEDDFYDGELAKEKSSELLNLLLDVLNTCFLYDNEGFVSKERFDTLMPPLVLQLENMQGGIESYQERIANHLVQSLVQLAIAAGDDGSWKPLNYQVCLKTRHSNPSVRFAALQVIESLHDKLGTDYMALLPETIQFLAELAEDENNEVEQKCHDVIKQLEKTLGEPLSKYF